MSDRERVMRKIRALLAKTTAAGASEQEALAAAAKAAELMREYGLSQTDLHMSEAKAKEKTTRATWRAGLAGIVAFVTNTSSIVLISGGGNEILFVGREPGPEIAVYLRDICFHAVEAELRKFKQAAFYRRRRTLATKRQAAADFIAGMVLRLQTRLIETFKPLLDEAVREEARNAVAARFKGAVSHRAPDRKMRFAPAAGAGYRAGGEIPLHHGVSTPTPQLIEAKL